MTAARAAACAIAAVSIALALGARAEAQTCSRQCDAGEGRDVYGCCVKRAEPHDEPATRKPKKKDPKADKRVVVPEPDPTTGSVLIDADDSAAKAYIDNIEVDDTLPTVVHRLVPGEHVVMVASDEVSWKRKVEIEAGSQVSVFAELSAGNATTMSENEERGRKILDSALRAKGGEAALRALAGVRYAGEAVHTTKPDQWEFRHTWAASPERSTFRLVSPRVDCRLTTTTSSAWRTYPKGAVDGIEAAEGDNVAVATGRLYAHPDLVLLRHREVGAIVTWIESSTVDGVDAHVVEIARADGSGKARLYIGKDDKMLLAVEQSGDTTTYSDYALLDTAGGQIVVPMQWRARLPVGTVDIAIQTVLPLRRVDDGVFAQPVIPSVRGAGKAIVPLETGQEIADELVLAAAGRGCRIDAWHRFGLTATCDEKRVVLRQRDRDLHAACEGRKAAKCELLVTKLLKASTAECDAACATARRDALSRVARPRATTGSIELTADVKSGRVLLDGDPIDDTLPMVIEDLAPGAHELTITTELTTWKKSVDVVAGEANAVFASVEGGKPRKKSKAARRAEKILARAIEARGGAKALAEAHTIVYSGVAKDDKLGELGFQQVWVDGGMAYTRLDHPDGTFFEYVQTSDDAWERYWAGSLQGVYGGQPDSSQFAGTKITDYRARSRSELWRHPDAVLSRYGEPGTRLQMGDDKTIDGVDCYRVVMGPKTGSLWDLFIAKDDYRLIRIGGTATFADHAGDGLVFPRKWSVHYQSPYYDLDIEIHDVQINPIVRSDLFERPIERWAWSTHTHRQRSVNGRYEVSTVAPLGPELIAGATKSGCDVMSSHRRGVAAMCGRTQIAVTQVEGEIAIACSEGTKAECHKRLRQLLIDAGFDEQ